MLGNPPGAECEEYFTSQPLPKSKDLALLFFLVLGLLVRGPSMLRGACITIGGNLIFI